MKEKKVMILKKRNVFFAILFIVLIVCILVYCKNKKKEVIIQNNVAKNEIDMENSDNVKIENRIKENISENIKRIKRIKGLDNLMCENCELYKEVKRISSLSSDDLLYDMTVDDKVEEPVTIEKAYDNYEDFGVAYEPKRETVKKEEPKIESNTTIINNTNTDVVIAEKIEIEDKRNEKEVDYEVEKEESVKVPSREESKKENKVDEDFFQLIDSMYKERVDE